MKVENIFKMLKSFLLFYLIGAIFLPGVNTAVSRSRYDLVLEKLADMLLERPERSKYLVKLL